MKLVTFFDVSEKLGVLTSDSEVADLSVDAQIAKLDMIGALETGDEFLAHANRILDIAPRLASKDVHLMAPVPRPRKILAIGVNYLGHIREAEGHGVKIPPVPMVFNKQVTSVVGPYDDVHLPKVSEQLDYEGELAIVIGKRCRHVKAEDAGDVIAGFTVLNDLSVRDWQLASATFTMGKSFDTHCPFGPALLTKDEVGPTPNLSLTTWVNEERRQHDHTGNLKYSCRDLIEYLTSVFTLEPGDIIPTGTPSGVAAIMKPPQWLKAGDVVKIEIEEIGAIINRVVEEPDRFLSTATPDRA